MQQLTATTQQLFQQIEMALTLLSPEQYTYKNSLMGNATVGQHVRHIIELYQQLLEGYAAGKINYEKRRRDVLIETDKTAALLQLQRILDFMQQPDKTMLLTASYGPDNGECSTTQTTYTREVMYNIEHTIHHLALIRIGFVSAFNIELPDTFGVAPATLKYRNACAQ